MRSVGLVMCGAALVCATGACTEHGQSPGILEDGPTAAQCMAQFDNSIDRACVTATDCVLVNHDDCCGVVVFGVHDSNADMFPGIEAELHRCAPCPPLGCQHQDVSEDGMTLQGNDTFAPVCNAGRCSSTVVPQ